MANFKLVDFPGESGGQVSINPQKITHIEDFMTGGEKWTKIFLEGGFEVTIRRPFDEVKAQLESSQQPELSIRQSR